MKYIIALIAFAVTSFASNLLSISVNEGHDNVELNMNFDKPFNGTMEQNSTATITALTVNGISIDSKKDIALSQNPLIKRVIMTKAGDKAVNLVFETKQEIALEATKNNDGYKLQLRAIIKPGTAKDGNKTEANATEVTKPEPVGDLSAQDDSGLGWRYFAMIGFLLVMIAIMLYVKKRFGIKAAKRAPAPSGSGSGIGGLFSSPKQTKSVDDIPELTIISQNYLDQTNRLMLIEFNKIRYLLLVGNSNAVVDRYYPQGVDAKSDDFKSIIADNEHKLNEFLKPKELSNLDEYRAKAEGNI